MTQIVVRVLGCGDAFGSGGRLQSCFLLDTSEERMLVDCGATALIAMRRHGIDPTSIDTVVLSHLHGDHFGGVPLLLLEAQFVSRRSDPLTIAGPPGTRDRLLQAMDVLYPGTADISWAFPLEFKELTAGTAEQLGAISVLPLEVEHPSGAPAFGLRLGCHGQVIAYSGDTEWTDELPKLARNADLLIMECFGYAPSIYHMDYKTLRAQLPLLSAKRIVLTHMGQEMLDRLARVELETAYDGMVIQLPGHPLSLAATRALRAVARAPCEDAEPIWLSGTSRPSGERRSRPPS